MKTLLGLLNILIGFVAASTFVVEYAPLGLYHHLSWQQLFGMGICIFITTFTTNLLWQG